MQHILLCSIALGLAFGLACVIWLRTVFNDYVVENHTDTHSFLHVLLRGELAAIITESTLAILPLSLVSPNCLKLIWMMNFCAACRS